MNRPPARAGEQAEPTRPEARDPYFIVADGVGGNSGATFRQGDVTEVNAHQMPRQAQPYQPKQLASEARPRTGFTRTRSGIIAINGCFGSSPRFPRVGSCSTRGRSGAGEISSGVHDAAVLRFSCGTGPRGSRKGRLSLRGMGSDSSRPGGRCAADDRRARRAR